MTNKEKIRKSDDELLLRILNQHGFCSSEVECREFSDCEACIKAWLDMVV